MVDAGPTPEQVRAADLAALPQSGGSMAGQMAAELAARVKDAETITFEQLKEALVKDGEGFGPDRQLMARAELAIYCARGDTLDGMILTVCEYPSAGQAERGEKEANLVQAKIAGHSSKHRKKSVLHVVAQSTTPTEKVAHVFEVFERL